MSERLRGCAIVLVICSACGDNQQLSVAADATVVPEGSEVTFTVDRADVTWDFGDGQQDTGPSVRHYFANDGEHHVIATSGPWSGSIDITVENVAPTFELGDPREWAPGRALDLAVSVEDPGIFDDVTATIDWGDGTVEKIDDRRERELALQHVYAAGSFTAVVTIADEGGSASDSVPIKVWPHQVIVIDANLPAWTAVGTPITGIASAADLDGNTVPVALTSAPSGMTLDSDGIIHWTPSPADAGMHGIVVSAGTATRRLSLTVSAVEIAASAMVTATAGGTIEITDPSSPLHGARIEVPAGALASDTMISIGRLVTPPPDGRDEPVGEAIELMPTGTIFAKDVTLRVPAARSDVSIATFSTTTLHAPADWIGLAHRSVANGFAQGTVRHFSPFRLYSSPRWEIYSNERFQIYYVPNGRDTPASGSKYKAAGTSYVPGVPVYVQDLAAALEKSYQAFDGAGYAPVLRDPINVRIMTRDTSAAYWDSSQFDIVFENSYPSFETVRGVAAHELFHKCQYHSYGSDPTLQYVGLTVHIAQRAKWIWEATATHMALEVMGGIQGGGGTQIGWLRDYGIAGVDRRGYAAFPLFKFLLARKQFDFTREMWAVRDSQGKALRPKMPELNENGYDYVYYRVRQVGAAMGGEHRLWGELAYAFQYGRTEKWMTGVRTWLDPAPITDDATATTGLERATPDATEQLPIQPTVIGVKANPAVIPGGVQTLALEPRCSLKDQANCMARKTINDPASGWEIVLRAGMLPRTKGIVHLAPIDPANLDADVEPKFLGMLENGKELAIPLSSLRGDYDQIVVSLFNGSRDTPDTVPLEAFFRKVTGKRLVASLESACWLREPDHRVWCWGANIYGELSNGTLDGFFGANTHPTAAPVLLDATSYLTGVERIWSNGDAHQMCVTLPLVDIGQSAAFCWGDGASNQFNTGTATAKYAYPVFATAGEIRDLATYRSSSCIVVENGGVDCWGLNFNYQLGNGLYDNLPSPRGPVLDTAFQPITGAIAVANSYWGANCALMMDRTVRCWGSNIRAGLGQPNTLGTSLHPIPVPGITDAVAISGGSSMCVLKADGTVRCWGDNPGGEVGDGTTEPHFLPFDPGVSNIVQISVGWATTCALDQSGVVWCWGNNDSFQLGRPYDSTAYIGLAPAPVAGLPAATEIAVGGDFACALVDEVPWCWGWNRFGQLGDGVPVPGFPYNSRYQPAPIYAP